MKRIKPFIFIFAPTIIGCIRNLVYLKIYSIPIINNIFYYGFPVLMLCFWFWVGGTFAQSKMNALASVLLGNLMGIVSLLLFVWQYYLIPDDQKNLFLASLSQTFSSTIHIFYARIAILFEPVKNVTSIVTVSAAQIMGLILMMATFTVGYYYKINKIKKNTILC